MANDQVNEATGQRGAENKDGLHKSFPRELQSQGQG